MWSIEIFLKLVTMATENVQFLEFVKMSLNVIIQPSVDLNAEHLSMQHYDLR